MSVDGCEVATLGGGCFWCSEAVFSRLRGVVRVVPGYSGGDVVDPTYLQVCSGRTGHAEVVQVVFDPEVIGFAELLEVFFATHDPSTLNRQGADVGTQYRSVIFYHGPEQKKVAEETIRRLEAEGTFRKIVTRVEPFKVFYPAEGYHMNYYENNKNQPYCMFVVAPKVGKLRRGFAEKLK
ncbi:MAG: peptide-methionine (S)-S-oxide reductase MsrA [Candidatus Bathyarchaeota archaeon]